MAHEAVALVGAAAVGGLIAVLPKLDAVRDAGPDDDLAHDLKTGLFVGGGIVLALAATAAIAARDVLPVVAAVVAVGVIAAGYLFVLHTRGTEGYC